MVDDFSPAGVPDFNCKCTRVIRPPAKAAPHIYRLNTLRNLGLQNAKYDPVIILDPDCVPTPHYLDNARRMCDPNILHGGRIDKQQADGSVNADGRLGSGRSRWVDTTDNRGASVWGGNMLFSKSRAQLVGWFDTDYNGVWGAEDADFAARCYHSGMRLRYSTELSVLHLYHKKSAVGYERNRKMWIEKSAEYAQRLNVNTPYKPAVGVMVITMMRPDLIDQCLQAVFRNRIPLKVRLVNNGDDSEETKKVCGRWGSRWAVDYIYHPRKWPAQVRNDSMRWAVDKKLKYLVFIDDDMLVDSDGMLNLVTAIERHPEFYALSGFLKHSKNNPEKMLGGPLHEGAFYNYPRTDGEKESDWVGGGFTVHRLNPLIPYDEGYETGYNDFDWSMTVKSRGLKLGVTGSAGAHHAFKLTPKGLEPYRNPPEYTAIRYDHERHARMRQRFKAKWGFEIGKGGLWREPS